MDILKLPFDQYQRYKIVQEAVNILRGKNQPLKILDVGGYPGMALGFFPDDELIIVDQEECDLPQYKKVDALYLPFSDGSFDVVTSVDVLEHIPPDKRQLFIKELCRVSKGYVCIAAPFDNPQVHEAELILFEFIKAKLGFEHHFLHDHLNYGLPKIEKTMVHLKEGMGGVTRIPNGNLSRWLPMMIMGSYLDIDSRYQTLKGLVNEYYNAHYYKMDNSEPCYRYLIVAGAEDKLAQFEKRLKALSCGPEDLRAADFSVVSTLIALTNADLLRRDDNQLQQKEELLRQKDNQLQQKEDQLRQKDNQIQQKEDQLRQKDNQIQRLFQSKSWRMTAPLRKMERILNLIVRGIP